MKMYPQTWDEKRRDLCYQLAALLLCPLALAIRLSYIFRCTDYSHYLASDMAGYWMRSAPGTSPSIPVEWSIWPPAAHQLLELCQIVSRMYFPLPDELAVCLILGSLAFSISVYFAWLIAWIVLITKHPVLILLSTSVYALLPSFILSSSVILSENEVIPIMTLALWLIVKPGYTKRSLTAAGALLALCICIRPALLPIVTFPVFYQSRYRRLFPSAAPLAIITTVLVGCAWNYVSTRGHLIGLSANGGICFLMQQTAVFSVTSEGYTISPPGASGILPPLHLHHAIIDQAWWYIEAYRLMPWWSPFWDVWNLRMLVLSPAFPQFTSMTAFTPMDLFSALVYGTLAIAFFRQSLTNQDTKVFAASIITVSLLYGSDRRFLYPYAALIIPYGIHALGMKKWIPRTIFNARPQRNPSILQPEVSCPF